MKSKIFSKFRATAFTLAEVIIVLGIIGIVAAMTIPNLIQKQQERANVNRLKKIYSVLNDGIQRMVVDNGTIDNLGDTNDERLQNLFNLFPKYFVVNEKVDTLKNYYWKKTILGSGLAYANGYKMLLNDGTMIVLSKGGRCIQDTALKNPPGSTYNYHICAEIHVFFDKFGDYTTLKKGENALDNQTVFNFAVVKNGIVPRGMPNETDKTEQFDYQCISAKSYPTHYPGRCTAWAIYNGNMDYLHCSDLSWSGKRECN